MAPSLPGKPGKPSSPVGPLSPLWPVVPSRPKKFGQWEYKHKKNFLKEKKVGSLEFSKNLLVCKSPGCKNKRLTMSELMKQCYTDFSFTQIKYFFEIWNLQTWTTLVSVSFVITNTSNILLSLKVTFNIDRSELSCLLFNQQSKMDLPIKNVYVKKKA